MRSSYAALVTTLALACAPAKSSTTDDGTTSDMTSDAPTTAGTEDGFECPPPPLGNFACVERGPTRATWQFETMWFMSGIDIPCTVTAVTDQGDVQTITLDFKGVEYSLQLRSSTPHVAVSLDVGATVRFQLEPISNGELDSSAYFLLRDADDNLLAAGIDGPTRALFLGSMDVRMRSSTCERSTSICELRRREALEVMRDGASVVLFDGHIDDLGDYRILVDQADLVECYGIAAECPTGFATWNVRALFIRAAD